MPSIMPGSELAPAWDHPDPIHLPALARKGLLVLRGSRGSGRRGRGRENMHTGTSTNRGSRGRRLLVGREKDRINEEMEEDFFHEQNL